MTEEATQVASTLAVQEEMFDEDPAAFLRGLLLACGLSVPAWVTLVWALTK